MSFSFCISPKKSEFQDYLLRCLGCNMKSHVWNFLLTVFQQ